MDAAIHAAESAFQTWRSSTRRERQTLLRSIAALVRPYTDGAPGARLEPSAVSESEVAHDGAPAEHGGAPAAPEQDTRVRGSLKP